MDMDQWERLAAVRGETGIPIAEQIRRAVDDWLLVKSGEITPPRYDDIFHDAMAVMDSEDTAE